MAETTRTSNRNINKTAKIWAVFFLLICFMASCKDGERSNTGASEYDKLMNKDDIVLDEEAIEDNTDLSDKPSSSGSMEKLVDIKSINETDVQFINRTPISTNYTGIKAEEHQRFLAAAKLCGNFDYKDELGENRYGNKKNGGERIKINSSCAALVPSPHISPFEYYYKLFYNFNEIANYQKNVFKLKEIREKLKLEYFESFNAQVMAAEPEKLVSYTLATSSIQNFDFDTGKLEIQYYLQNSLPIGGANGKVAAMGRRNRNIAHFIPMPEKQAREIYKHYTEINEFQKNPPFRLTTKTTYALSIPSIESRPYNFEIDIKKIEFFKAGNGYPEPSDKIGEIRLTKQAIQ